MKPILGLFAVLAIASLSACFTSKEALVGDDAVAPHAKITFIGQSDDSDPAEFTREGNAYISRKEGEDTVWLHLKPIDGDFYVAQMSGPGDDGGTEYLFGYIRIDVAAKVADTWKAVGGVSDVRPGLSECDDVICVDDLDAYIAYAQEAIAAGEEPDISFDIVVE
jgi:hypothetical protein